MRLALRVLRDLIGMLPIGIVAALGFLLFTEAGARIVLRELEARLGTIHAEGLRGTLWGPIAFDRFRYEDGSVRVVLDNPHLDGSLLPALTRYVAVSELTANALVIEIKPRTDEAAETPDDGGALTRLPVQLDVQAVRVARFDLRVPGVEPMHFEDVRLSGSWIDDAVRLEHLAAKTPWVGPLRFDGAAQLDAEGIAF
ncbi:MAG: hypothetical protein ACLGI7_14425, partial [Gammaproteobacteria bacterium]